MRKNLVSTKVVIGAWAFKEKGWWTERQAWDFVGLDVSESVLDEFNRHMWPLTKEGDDKAAEFVKDFAKEFLDESAS